MRYLLYVLWAMTITGIASGMIWLGMPQHARSSFRSTVLVGAILGGICAVLAILAVAL